MLCFKVLFLLYILIFMRECRNCLCFHVEFRRFHDAQIEPFNTQMQKREMAQLFDKAAYSFNGFTKLESVPVPFPIDICILQLEGIKYATTLHNQKDGVRHFAVYKYIHNNYVPFFDIEMPKATAMDCKALGSKGYIAVANNLTQTVQNARDGSPIFELSADRLRAVQYFDTTQLFKVYLRVSGNDLFLLQTYRYNDTAPNLNCPYYKWGGATFIRLGRIPCSNSRHMEPFSINYENYVAVANYADQRGRTTAYSEIYKFIREKKRFQLFQKIRTYGAVDVRYFSVPYEEVKRRHFLIFGNSINRQGDLNAEARSVFYVYEKGQFVPYQSISLYAVQQFLPVQNIDAEKFLLLVAANEQDTKIYNLNDWKFEPSDVQFTEGALGKGVDNMRVYQENEQSYLVIANDEMSENDTNIFQPIYKRDEHANALRQQIIDWTKTQLERLKHIEVDKLKQSAKQKLLKKPQRKINTEVKNVAKSNIKTVHTNAFVYAKKHFTTSYWEALSFATQALDALEAEQQTDTTRAKRDLDNQNLMENVINSNTFTNIKVNTLVVQEELRARKVNGIDTNKPNFERISAKKVRVTDTYIDLSNSSSVANDTLAAQSDSAEQPMLLTLSIADLQLNGKLNEYHWHEVLNQTLKRSGIQFIKQAARISNLTAETVMITQDEIAGHELHKLIPIDGGNYVINQNVHFKEPVKAKTVIIHERLNDIHVQHDKLDVLLKRSNKTQLVRGEKGFENVRVLQPIAVAGQLLGSHLRLMAPHQVIHDDLVLHGDYVIHGDVIVVEHLSANDMIAQNTNISVKDTLANALLLTEPLEDVNIRFAQPVVANNTQLSFINVHDLQQLIKTHLAEIQVIDGAKFFPSSLVIHNGLSVVKHLNNIDVEQLDQRLLTRSTNQTIRVPMYFDKIIAPIVISTNLTLNHKPLTAYLTKSGNQHIPATLHVNRLTAKTANFQTLYSNGRLFNEQIAQLQQQARARGTGEVNVDILRPQRKFQGTIFVDNLRINSSINNNAVNDIEQQLRQLSNNIHFMGNYKFNHDMNISHLSFQGSFNGIAAREFGSTWLQKTGAQTFTAPQTFASVESVAGLQLDGALNGYQVNEFITNTYWIDRDEHISEIVFENPIQVRSHMRTGTVNGVHVPLDMLFSNTTEPQQLYTSAYVHENLNVRGGGIFNVSTVNGLNLMALEEFLMTGYGFDTLHVEHANFEQAPSYQTLNGHNLQQLLESAWLTNENVDLNQHVELADASFEGLLDFEGLVNNLNLQYLKQNYLSLSRPQDIYSDIVFTGDVQFESDFTVNNLQLNGELIETTSNEAINFNEFAANTLKTNGAHDISAVWSIVNAQVAGDLHDVRINNLDLAHDVLRMNVPYAEITAPKYINGPVVIKKLYPTPTSTVNGVPVASWLRDAVYVFTNQTIRGVTTLDDVNVSGDLCVQGSVNNLTHFDDQTLLLRDTTQTLQGNVRIQNVFPITKRVLLNNVENLRAETINGQNIDQFYANLAKTDSDVTVVQGNLIFAQPLVVEEYHNEVYELASKSRRHITAAPIDSDGTHLKSVLHSSLAASVQQLGKALQSTEYILDHFEVHQELSSSNATRFVPLTLKTREEGQLQIFVALNDHIERLAMGYYMWSVPEQRFMPLANYSWLPQQQPHMHILLELMSQNNESFNTNETIRMLTNSLIDFKNIPEFEQQQLPATLFKIEGQSCIPTSSALMCLASNGTNHKKLSYPQGKVNVKQLVLLSSKSLAALLPNSMEIWSIISNKFQILQRITLLEGKHLAFGKLLNNTYLAVINTNGANSSMQTTVDIYSASYGSNYRKMQSLICIAPKQLAFSVLPQTGDLLLHVLSDAVEQPLQIYQYKGVMGFKKIVGLTTLPLAQHMQVLTLETSKRQQQHFIALFSSQSITFVKIVLKQFGFEA